jgi:hypothetical protein
MIKFISYDGHYPNLCSGTLVLEMNGIQYSIIRGLSSGGSVSFDEHWSEEVTDGPWTLNIDNFPAILKPLEYEITHLINAHIPWGCCGGCV